MNKIIMVSALLSACATENSLLGEQNIFQSEGGSSVSLEPILQTDIFPGFNPSSVDIMFVVDQSGSMNSKLTSITNNIPIFLRELDDSMTAYRAGVISTSNQLEYAGKLTEAFQYKYIDTDTEEKEIVFSAMIHGALGNEEAGIDALWAALSPRYSLEENMSFFREGTSLHIVFISDEANQSQIRASRMYQRLLEVEHIKGESVVVSSITHGHVPGPCFNIGESPGYDYMRLAFLTGGSILDICSDDWSLSLESLASYIRPEPTYEYPLSQVPSVETLSVMVERKGVMINYNHLITGKDTRTRGHSYDESRNMIRIYDYEEEEGDLITITYEVLQTEYQ